MKTEKELPTLRGEPLYIPFVGAIIEKTNHEGIKQILIQIRQKESDPTYNGRIEIPGGKCQAYEDIYQTVRREVKEESGLDITFIQNEEQRIDYPVGNDMSTLVEPFCVTQMQNGPFVGLIFLCRAVGTPAEQTNETKEIRWICLKELKEIVQKAPEKFYPPSLGPLKKYIAYKLV